MATLLTIAVAASATFTPPEVSDREARVLLAAKELVQIGYIERERRRADVPDDFATGALSTSRRLLASVEPSIRRDAEPKARRILNAKNETRWLRSWPDPWTIRADIAARSRGESGVVIAARQAGRMLMFRGALDDFAGTIFDARMPLDVQARRVAYVTHYFDARDRWRPRFESACPKRGPCTRRTYYQVESDYHFGLQPATEAANLYLPPSQRAKFIDVTDSRGSRNPAPTPPTNTTPPFSDRDPPLAILSLVAIVVFGTLLFFLFRSGRRNEPILTSHGSARFAAMSFGLPANQEILFQGAFLGFSSDPHLKKEVIGSPVLTAPENHTLIVAPSRSGKGTRVIIPTLLLYSGSMIVVDPKGENGATTARYRREQLGHKVHIINPWGALADTFASHGFKSESLNPLDILDRNDPDVVATAQAMANAICSRASTKDTIWENQASALMTALLLWVTDQPGETKTLGRIADLVSGGEKGEDLRTTILPKIIASSSFEGAMRKSVGQLINLAEETYSGVIFNLTESLQFLVDNQLVKATDHSTFDLSDLTREGTTIFLVIPPERLKAQAVWLRLLLAAVSNTFKRHKPAAEGRRAMFLIDEFSALGRMNDFVEDIAFVGGYGLDYTIAVQDLGQLERLYGDARHTIISNCGWKWFCNVQDLQTAQYVSTALGTATIQSRSQTIGSGPQGQGSETVGEMGRSLMTHDEVTSLGKNVAFAFRPGARPHYLKPCDYWDLNDCLTKSRLKSDGPLILPDLNKYDVNPLRQHKDFARKVSGLFPRMLFPDFEKPEPSVILVDDPPPAATEELAPEPPPQDPPPSPPSGPVEVPILSDGFAQERPWTREEALEYLCLEDSATMDDIRLAYLLAYDAAVEGPEGNKERQLLGYALRALTNSGIGKPPQSGRFDF